MLERRARSAAVSPSRRRSGAIRPGAAAQNRARSCADGQHEAAGRPPLIAVKQQIEVEGARIEQPGANRPSRSSILRQASKSSSDSVRCGLLRPRSEISERRPDRPARSHKETRRRAAAPGVLPQQPQGGAQLRWAVAQVTAQGDPGARGVRCWLRRQHNPKRRESGRTVF